jgi:hypothetical protein
LWVLKFFFIALLMFYKHIFHPAGWGGICVSPRLVPLIAARRSYH